MQKLLNERAKFIHISLRVCGGRVVEREGDAFMFILLFNFANLCNHNILRRINTTLLGEPRPHFPFSLCHSLSLCVLKMSLKRRMVHTGRGWGGQEGLRCALGGVGADKSQRLKDSSTSTLPLSHSLCRFISLISA